MPQLDDVEAIMWEIEADYLPDSDDALITWGKWLVVLATHNTALAMKNWL